MKNRNQCRFIISASLIIVIVLNTLAIKGIDVKPIGPQNSSVGFAFVNGWAHALFGVNMLLYTITDWGGILPLLIAVGFGILGLIQWITRKNLSRVDSSILVLGGFYLLVFGIYLFFEFFIINYRPVLIDGYLEASYPSSTTMLVLCIMPTAMMQFHRLISDRKARLIINTLCACFTLFMVMGRLFSGVHWLTDIFGSILLSSALVLLYVSVNDLIQKTNTNN